MDVVSAGADPLPREAGEDEAKDEAARIVPLNTLPSLLRGDCEGAYDPKDMEERNDLGHMTRRAEVATMLHTFKQAADRQRAGDEAASRTIRSSDALDAGDFLDVVEGVEPHSHFIVTFSNYDQPPLIRTRQPMVRIVDGVRSARGVNDRLAAARAAAQSGGLPGTPRAIPAARWTAIMASPTEQDDAKLAAAHVKAVLERAAWYLKVRREVVAMGRARKLPPRAIAGLFDVFEPPMQTIVPTGTLRREPLFMDAAALAAARNAAAVEARSMQIEQREAALRARRREALMGGSTMSPTTSTPAPISTADGARPKRLDDPLPASTLGENAFIMMSMLPDLTLHEHLWIPHVNERCAALNIRVPPLKPSRAFDDDIPRPLVRMYPLVLHPNTPPDVLEAYRVAMQGLVDDHPVADLDVGAWLNPQNPNTTATKRVRRGEGGEGADPQDAMGAAHAARNANSAMRKQFDKACEDLGIDAEAATVRVGPTTELALHTLREKYSQWQGVGEHLDVRTRRRNRADQAGIPGTVPLEPGMAAALAAMTSSWTKKWKVQGKK